MKSKFNLYEKGFLIIGILVNVLFTIIAKGSILSLIFSILCVLNAVYAAKGLILGYVFEIFSTAIYIYLSFKQRFYSEVLTSVFILLPFTIYGLINWSKNKSQKSDTIVVHKSSKKQLIILLISQVALYPIYYKVLVLLNTELPYVSALSICTSVSAFYLLAATSNLSYFFFILKDIVGFVMWIYPLVILHIPGNITVLITNILYGINDCYGLYNWNKMLKNQTKSQ